MNAGMVTDSLLYFQDLTQRWSHNSHSMNICWIEEQVNSIKGLGSINILIWGIYTFVWFSLFQLSEDMFERVNEIKAELALKNQGTIKRQWLAKRKSHWQGRKGQVLVERWEGPFMGIKKMATKTWVWPLISSPRPPLMKGWFHGWVQHQDTCPWSSGFTQG